jgi:Holliday junction resolvase-like predicted endonuclease
MSRTVPLEKSLAIFTPVAWSTTQKGNFLESLAADILRRQSHEVTERIRFTGMEIDVLALHKPSSDLVYVECKFLSETVGSNVIDLMIGQSFRRNISRIALFSAGLLGKEAKGAVEELKKDKRISFAFYGPDALLEALIDSGTAPQLSLAVDLPSVSHATLLVYPELPYIWLLQDQKDGRPYRIIPYAPPGARLPQPSEIRELLDEHEMLEGLPVVDYLAADNSTSSRITPLAPAPVPAEVVGRVATADTILDYRPCRPEDFVGRLGLQKELWDFLSDVRDKATSTRLVAIVGASGYGKSSLVAKLAERFRNKKWKNKYFLFPVDVRSARGPLFVAEALLQAIRNAAETEFLEPPNNLSITDADSVLSSDSIVQVLAALQREHKVLVVFFDQFEELFTKDELLPVFRAFRRFALDVHSKNSNLVVGFSWRTGISFSDDNPAYQLWNELRDYRITKQLGPFDNAESSGLVSQFEDHLDEKLLPPLRRRLQEQGQGLPWFLKKLCIHVYGQIKRGVSQVDLLGSRLNVQALFDEDLDPLTEAQLSCLRFIATNSPVDSLEVFEHYGPDVVSGLSEKRLIVRAGQRFAVYWDIFRDYLTEGKVPAIPWTYMPNSSLGMALSACYALELHGAMSTIDLAEELSYSEATTVNIVTDLQNFALCGKDSGGRHLLLDGVNADSIPDRLRSQFAEHVLLKRLQEHAGDTDKLSRTRAIEIVRALYSSADVKPSTRDNYLTRLLPWLEYAGLVEADAIDIHVCRATKRGRRFGSPQARTRSSRGSVFLASAPPEVSEQLLRRLLSPAALKRETIAAQGLRNPALDLVALGIARWNSSRLVAMKQAPNSEARRILSRAAEESVAIVVLRNLIKTHPDATRSEIGQMLATQLGRAWKPSSALRNANGLYRYREYIAETPLLEPLPGAAQQGNAADKRAAPARS